MKIKLTNKITGNSTIVDFSDIDGISLGSKLNDFNSGMGFDGQYYFSKNLASDHTFEAITEHESIPTQKPMSALEHLQKVKELIG